MRPFKLLAFAIIISAAAILLYGCSTWPSAADSKSGSSVKGTWDGTLKVNGGQLRVVIHISGDDKENLSATMDSPDQGATGIPVSNVNYKDGKLKLSVQAVNGSYEGTLVSSGKEINGTWTQNGMSLPLDLKLATKSGSTVKRPQEPSKPYPYKEEEVTFDNDTAGIKLAGTLTLPKEKGPFPAVLLITGSGPQDRNETVFGHKPFLVLADYLTRRGIAVLRVDDRGIGGSTGSMADATSKDFSGDVLAGIQYLKDRTDIDPKHIGLLGHSEGALIAPMVAVKSNDVAFIVLLAAPAVKGEDILYEQGKLILKANGASKDQIAEEYETQKQIFDILKHERDQTEAELKLRKAIKKSSPESPEGAVEAQIAQTMSKWFTFFISYDPQPTLQKVKVPVLALYGKNDLQVPPAQNAGVLKQVLQKGGNKQITVDVIPGLNHLLQTSKTGSPSEYAKIEETISPSALKAIGDWLEGVVRK